MNTDRLIQMANQISLFFESQPSTEGPAPGIADHIKRFWDPRMRTEIIRHVSAGGAGLREPARAAVVRLTADN